MSFSSDIKERLCESKLKCDNCSIALLAGMFCFAGRHSAEGIRFATENEMIAESICAVAKSCLGIDLEYIKNTRAYQFLLDDEEIKTTLNNWRKKEHKCCVKAYIRGAFLGGGSVTDPQNSYHLEFDTKDEEKAKELLELLSEDGISAKLTERKGIYLVYIKESEIIADLLGYMGAQGGALTMFSVQVEKEMRNSINRRVNCEAANADKMAMASSKHLVAILKIKDAGKWASLPETLQEIGMLREEFPGLSLKELGGKANPPIGKSGVNHRLDRLIKIADEI